MTFNFFASESKKFDINFLNLKSHLASLSSEQLYTMFINTAKEFPKSDSSIFAALDRVSGCQSTLFFKIKFDGKSLKFYASSNSLFTLGLTGIFYYLFENLPLEEVIKIDSKWISQLDLAEFLSPLRLNGLHFLFTHLQRQCLFLVINA